MAPLGETLAERGSVLRITSRKNPRGSGNVASFLISTPSMGVMHQQSLLLILCRHTWATLIIPPNDDSTQSKEAPLSRAEPLFTRQPCIPTEEVSPITDYRSFSRNRNAHPIADEQNRTGPHQGGVGCLQCTN